MTSIQLYKFITENNIEWRWEENNKNQDVLIFVYNYNIDDFNEMFSYNHLADEGLECTMMKDYFCFWMRAICDYYDIQLEEVFTK